MMEILRWVLLTFISISNYLREGFNMKKISIYIILLLTTPVLVLANSICSPSMSIVQCNNKVTDTINPNKPKNVDEKEAALKSALTTGDKKIATKNTGGIGKGTATTTDDFISKLLTSFILGDLGNDQDSGFQFEWTDPVKVLPVGHDYKITLSAEPAKVYEPLANAINDKTITDSLEKNLNVLDNIKFGFKYTISNKRFGRNIQFHKDIFSNVFDNEFQSAISKVEDLDTKWRRLNRLAEVQVGLARDKPLNSLSYNTYLNKINSNTSGFISECKALKLVGQSDPINDATKKSCFDSLKQTYLFAAEERQIANETYLVDLDMRLDKGDYSKLISLLNNQPQLVLDASAAVKDDLVGPNEYSVSLRWEQGITSLNTLTRTCEKIEGHPRNFNGSYSQEFHKCIMSQLKQIPDKSISANNRMFISLEYSKRDNYHKVVTKPSINFSKKGTESLKVKAGYGQYISFTESGDAQSRIDFTASYEYVTGEDKAIPKAQQKNDRVNLDLVYSRKLVGDLVGIFGLSYANKAEYLENVDSEFSANLGISYKFSQNKSF